MLTFLFGLAKDSTIGDNTAISVGILMGVAGIVGTLIGWLIKTLDVYVRKDVLEPMMKAIHERLAGIEKNGDQRAMQMDDIKDRLSRIEQKVDSHARSESDDRSDRR